MENSAVEKIIEYCEKQKNMDVNSHRGAYLNIINFCEQAKEMEQAQKETIQMLEYDVEARDKYIALLESQLRIQDIAINRNV